MTEIGATSKLLIQTDHTVLLAVTRSVCAKKKPRASTGLVKGGSVETKAGGLSIVNRNRSWFRKSTTRLPSNQRSPLPRLLTCRI